MEMTPISTALTMTLQLSIVLCYQQMPVPSSQKSWHNKDFMFMSQSKSVSELLHFLLPRILFCSAWLRKMSLIWLKSHLFASEESLKDKRKVLCKSQGTKTGRDCISGSAVTFRAEHVEPAPGPCEAHLVGKGLTQSSCASSRCE